MVVKNLAAFEATYAADGLSCPVATLARHLFLMPAIRASRGSNTHYTLFSVARVVSYGRSDMNFRPVSKSISIRKPLASRVG